jgi:hypothetical protein
MLTAHFHDADGQLVRMQSDAQNAINDVLRAGRGAAREACRIVPGVPDGANVTGSGSVQEASMMASNICQRPVATPMTLMAGLASPYPVFGQYPVYGGMGRARHPIFGDAYDTSGETTAAAVVTGGQQAASDVCKITPTILVSPGQGAGNVQYSAQRSDAMCGRTQQGTSASSGNVLPPTQAPKYSSACRTRYNASQHMWAVYCPKNMVAKSGLAGMFGALADVAVTPPPPDGMVKVADETEQPTGATPDGQEQDQPFYKNWKFWAAVGGGVAVLGGGSYLIFRRR